MGSLDYSELPIFVFTYIPNKQYVNLGTMETIKLNSKGEDVKHLQELLGLKVDGDFGPKTDAAVKKYQEDHGLLADGVVGPKTWDILLPKNNIGIIKDPINIHITKKPGRPIKYLVIHFTAGASSKDGSAKKNRNVFLTRNASADFVVDDENIIQVNPDLKNYYCWAVGDGNGKYGITNTNSISIEMCSNLKKGASASMPNHSGWYFTDQVLNKTIKLAKHLMQTYNIPIERVVRHYDASRKPCPGIVGWNDGTLYDESGKKIGTNSSEKWKEFKNKLI